MASKKEKPADSSAKKAGTISQAKDNGDDFTVDLIKSLNKEFGTRVAYNLSEAEAPTIVKRWIDTGSIQLNYAIRNAPGGGYPEARVIEISGVPSSGKSHLAYHAAANVQASGGVVVYIDTENATPVDKLKYMGIDVRKKFVYVDTHCTEEVFKVIESAILKSRQMNKDVPIFIIWDSVAATSPKAELEGDYDKDTMGLQARVIGKCMRKIVGVLGTSNSTLLCINQLRDAIGVMHGDPHTTPGGKAIPFASSVRIRLTSATQVKDKAGNVIGIHVVATIKKNKVGPPFKKYEFDIIFGVGIVEHEYMFDECRSYCADNEIIVDYELKGVPTKVKLEITGTGAWKEFNVIEVATKTNLLQKKFYKSEFGAVMKDPIYKPFIDKIVEATYTTVFDSTTEAAPPADTEEEEIDYGAEDISEETV